MTRFNVIRFWKVITWFFVAPAKRDLRAIDVRRISMIAKVLSARRIIRIVSMDWILLFANVKQISCEVGILVWGRWIAIRALFRCRGCVCGAESLPFIPVPFQCDLLQFKWWTISLYVPTDLHWRSMRRRYWWMYSFSIDLSQRGNVSDERRDF